MEAITILKSEISEIVREIAYEIQKEKNIPQTAWISTNKANQLYGGRTLVASMINRGKIHFIRTDGQVLLKVEDLERELGKMVQLNTIKKK